MTFPFDDASIEDSSHHLAVALLPEGVSRDAIRTHLQGERIQTSVHYPPIHRFTYYSETGERRALPRTDAIADRILTLAALSPHADDHVTLVADALQRGLRVETGNRSASTLSS